ncbi:hypothetical protein VCV18_005439 [Metarhizium anisopliae]
MMRLEHCTWLRIEEYFELTQWSFVQHILIILLCSLPSFDEVNPVRKEYRAPTISAHRQGVVRACGAFAGFVVCNCSIQTNKESVMWWSEPGFGAAEA